jgi:hypothetical protein
MTKSNTWILRFSGAIFAALSATALCGPAAAAQQSASQPQVLSKAIVNTPVHSDVSAPLTALTASASVPQASDTTHAPIKPKLLQLASAPLTRTGTVSAAQPTVSALEPPRPLISARRGLGFAGVDEVDDALDCPAVIGHSPVPPDTNAAVGDAQVVQWVNDCYAVFDKASGGLIAGPFAGNQFWAGFGGDCETKNDGDPIIQWDKANHVWVASQNTFGVSGSGSTQRTDPPYFTCIAVSQTADATGSYNRYAFTQRPGFPDYPKWGLSGNAYYQTQNVFVCDPGTGNPGCLFSNLNTFGGVNVCAYEGDAMRAGRPARQICILDNSGFDDSMLPADDDTPGRTGPEVLLGAIDNFLPGDSHVYEFVFTVDFEEPENSTLAGVNGTMPINVPAFRLAICPPGAFNTFCVPQPTPGSDLLDTLGDRLMYRLARFVDADGGPQHFLVTHTVNDTAAVGARWYEFRAQPDSTSLSLYQSGQTPDDRHYRWMGSIAMDKHGDIALGYSRSSAREEDFPSIYFSGQTARDPLGSTEREALIKRGHGSQLNSFGRWGDYSSMALDGADSCTFWYTNQYYPADGTRAWATWIESLKFRKCGPGEGD